MSNIEQAFNEDDIERALEERQFELWFQPQYDLRTRGIVACEGMIRWRHPSLGLLPPGLFLDAVRAYERMPELTRCVVTLGGKAMARWREAGHAWRLNLNIAASDLVEPSFALLAEAELDQAGMPPGAVTFEVGEREFSDAGDAALRGADNLRRANFGLALESRGSRLLDEALMASGVFTEFKLSGPTLLRMGAVQRASGGGLVGARLREAKAGGLPAIAVGAENEMVLAALGKMGFDRAQGHALAPAAPLRDILARVPAPDADAPRETAEDSPEDAESRRYEELILEARRSRMTEADAEESDEAGDAAEKTEAA